MTSTTTKYTFNNITKYMDVYIYMHSVSRPVSQSVSR